MFLTAELENIVFLAGVKLMTSCILRQIHADIKAGESVMSSHERPDSARSEQVINVPVFVRPVAATFVIRDPTGNCVDKTELLSVSYVSETARIATLVPECNLQK